MKNLAELLASLRERHMGEAMDPDPVLEHCINCNTSLLDAELYARFRICPTCRFHYTIGAHERIGLLVDGESFKETQRSLISIDPLSFEGQTSYRQKIFEEQRRTGLSDAIVTGTAMVRGRSIVLAVIDFRFFGGSFGCVVGEKLTLALELAARRHLPAVVVVSSGGIRMQEGLLSLLQAAKTAAAAERLAAAHAPLITILANPSIGAAYSGIVSLSDVILAEPGAIVGYATTRALEASSGGHLPPGAHTAESHFAHGLIDQIVHRDHQRDFVSSLLEMLASTYRLTPTTVQPHDSGLALSAEPWNTVQLARHEQRPTALDYISGMTTGFIELHGDRVDGDDASVIFGVGQLGGESVVLLGQERRAGESAARGIRPEGFRKARRAMLLAAKLRLPLITLIDTIGAAVDLAAEESGLGSAMASCLATAASLPVPSVGVIIGEGGGEAALAFGVVNRLLMMENAIFVPVSPESAASILYRDPGRADSAAEALRLTARDCARLGVVDGVIPEPVGGAHAAHAEAAREVRLAIMRELTAIQTESGRGLIQQRYRKLRGMGRYSNYIGVKVAQEVGDLGGAVGRKAAALVSRLRRQGAAEAPTGDESMLIP
jgi:acetyl-CoA carboxylase carboxyl transferase beta subunit/acetyl-CoA carboxylase carboxyl transferase alpha subunit